MGEGQAGRFYGINNSVMDRLPRDTVAVSGVASSVYSQVCQESVMAPAQTVVSRFDPSTMAHSRYLEAISSYSNNVGFLEKLLYKWLPSSWVMGMFRRRFTAHLNGGRGCPEGSPARESFMPSPPTDKADYYRYETQRTVAGAMLDTNLFHQARETNLPILQIDQTALTGTDFRDNRARGRLARLAGFSPASSVYDAGIYRNANGNMLIVNPDYILWNLKEPEAFAGVAFTQNENGRMARHATFRIIRDWKGTRHPLSERHSVIARYIDGLSDAVLSYLQLKSDVNLPVRDDPTGFFDVVNGMPLPFQDIHQVMNAFGYSVSLDPGMRSGQFLDSIVAMAAKFDSESTKYQAAILYYVAAGMFLSRWDVNKAESMLSEMSRCLSTLGINYIEDISDIGTALTWLRRRLQGDATERPRPPENTGSDGTMSSAPTSPVASGPSGTVLAYPGVSNPQGAASRTGEIQFADGQEEIGFAETQFVGSSATAATQSPFVPSQPLSVTRPVSAVVLGAVRLTNPRPAGSR